MEALLAYDPARLRALALRTAATIQGLDARNSTEPMAHDAIATLRSISHTLSTTWMSWFSSVLGDTSMTGWDSDGPADAVPTAQGFAGASRAVSGAVNPEQIAGDMVDLAAAVERKEPGALAALSEMMGQHGDDAAVMSAFARQMGPDAFQAFVVLLAGGDIYPIGFATPELAEARDGILGVLLPSPLQLDTDPDFDLSQAVSLGGDGTISWGDAINPGCVTFPGGSYGGGGFVTGPEGREYPIVIPGVPVDGGVYTADIGPVQAGQPCVGNLNGSDEVWTPIGYQSGVERFQVAPNWADEMLGFFAGTTGVVSPLPPSSGLQFIQMRPNAMPALATTPSGSPAPVGSSDPGLTDLVEVPNAQAGLDLAVSGRDGWVFATNMDNQRERAYQVIYETNEADGRVRARIQTYTLAMDSNGDIVIVPEDIWVNSEGILMSQLTTYAPSDGSSGVLTNVADVSSLPARHPLRTRCRSRPSRPSQHDYFWIGGCGCRHAGRVRSPRVRRDADALPRATVSDVPGLSTWGRSRWPWTAGCSWRGFGDSHRFRFRPGPRYSLIVGRRPHGECRITTLGHVTDPALTYSSYLALDEVLGAQRPRSDEHDEMLFIVIHQVYELWFKELLHELGRAQELLETGQTPRVLFTLKRVLTILKVAVSQVDVLETMTPSQFSHFRDRLDAASGFQSGQFRELEAVLGIRSARTQPGAAGERLEAARNRPSLWDSYVRYLATQGYAVPHDALERDITLPIEPDAQIQDILLLVYAHDGGAAQVTERLVDLDEGLQEWRYRHVKMVERTIGDKPGTGGSMGAAYLRSTLSQPVFPDVWAVRSRL